MDQSKLCINKRCPGYGLSSECARIQSCSPKDCKPALKVSEERDPIQEAEYRAGACGTDEFFREMTTPEREPDYPDPGEDNPETEDFEEES